MAFTIRRGKLPTDHFTIIPNAYLRDDRLTWQTRGLLGWMMSHTAEFEITEEAMIQAGNAKRDGVRAMVGQLEEFGYLRRDRTFVAGGGSTVAYVLLDPDDVSAVAPNDGSAVLQDDQGKQTDLAGHLDDGSAVPPSYKEDQKKNTQKTSSSARASRSTATRVPEDFIPSQQMRDWFAAEKLHHVVDVRTEHEKFMDYWRAEPGAKGRKLDWPATWRRWMRTAAERADRYGSFSRAVNAPPGTSLMPSSGAPQYGGLSTTSTTNKRVLEGLALVEKFRRMEEGQP